MNEKKWICLIAVAQISLNIYAGHFFRVYAIIKSVKGTAVATVPRSALSQLEGYGIGLGTQPESQYDE